jgi:exo-1,4-beta-D-glucosaminidase
MVFQHLSSPVRLLQAALSCLAAPVFAAPEPLRNSIETIPSWKVQSTSKVGNDISKLSDSRLDTSSWYTIKSKATLMSTLLENNVYNETHLFFSDNLKQVDKAQFTVPWLYRADIHHSKNDAFVQLKTNGISSRADIYLNGELLGKQIGAYVGKEYDISKKLRMGKNTLVVRVYPTDYNRDFALGFVDWNPAPPDNGTGIWRDVEVKRSGAISLSQPRITTALDGSVEVFVDAKNLGSNSAHVDVACTITGPNGKKTVGKPRATVNVGIKKTKTVSLKAKIKDPQIWWPKQWGKQPLYSVQCDARVASKLSDRTPHTSFGIRTVTSKLSALNDTTFFVNDQRFQVVGAGYTSDIFLRFDEDKLQAQLRYVLDMGLNTIRLEGKQEHPLLYQLADQMGIMLIAGWECCDKWEGWTYNEDGSGEKWSDEDYE